MNTPEQASTQPRASALQVEWGAPQPTHHTRRVWLVRLLVLLAIVAGGAAWLWAQGPQPAFGALVASPSNLVFNTATTVTFTIRIDTPTLNPTTVELLQVDAAGSLLRSVGRMYDNGQGGDVKPGDRLFTVVVTLNEPTIGRIYFRVAAAFRGNRHNAQSALFALDVDPFPLPPDPGEAGKQTLEGIDSDGDGIRDDIQRWIAITFANTPTTRAALTQMTQSITPFIVDGLTEERAVALSTRLSDALDCLQYVVGIDRSGDNYRSLRSVVLNTPERGRAWTVAQTQLSGHGLTVTPAEQRRERCSFNPDNL